jgi:putative intracellular protease/amidase
MSNAKRILIPVPDKDFDTTEVAVPWKLWTEAGHEVVFATENGAKPACDPLLINGVIFGKLGADPEPKEFYAQMEASKEMNAPLRWDAIDVSSFDALHMPGGHAPGMKQYLASETLFGKVAAFWKTGRPVTAICHGVLVLARAKDEQGKSLLADKRTTCLPKYMERAAYFSTFWKLGTYYRTYPAYVEDEVKENLTSPSQFERGPLHLAAKGSRTDDTNAFVVEDGSYVSARWPGDAYLLAKKLLERL